MFAPPGLDRVPVTNTVVLVTVPRVRPRVGVLNGIISKKGSVVVSSICEKGGMVSSPICEKG